VGGTFRAEEGSGRRHRTQVVVGAGVEPSHDAKRTVLTSRQGAKVDGVASALVARGTAHFCDAVLVMEALSSGLLVAFVRHYVNDEISPVLSNSALDSWQSEVSRVGATPRVIIFSNFLLYPNDRVKAANRGT